jgi:hypothetical protein
VLSAEGSDLVHLFSSSAVSDSEDERHNAKSHSQDVANQRKGHGSLPMPHFG